MHVANINRNFRIKVRRHRVRERATVALVAVAIELHGHAEFSSASDRVILLQEATGVKKVQGLSFIQCVGTRLQDF